MNSLVLLLAAVAPGGDPVTQVQYPPPVPDFALPGRPMPMYAPSPYAAGGYSESNAWAQPEKHPRFPRLRAFFNRHSHGKDQADQDSPPNGHGMPGVKRSVVSPEAATESPEFVTPPDGAVIVTPAPTSTPATKPAATPERINTPPTPVAPTKKMPAGDPF